MCQTDGNMHLALSRSFTTNCSSCSWLYTLARMSPNQSSSTLRLCATDRKVLVQVCPCSWIYSRSSFSFTRFILLPSPLCYILKFMCMDRLPNFSQPLLTKCRKNSQFFCASATLYMIIRSTCSSLSPSSKAKLQGWKGSTASLMRFQSRFLCVDEPRTLPYLDNLQARMLVTFMKQLILALMVRLMLTGGRFCLSSISQARRKYADTKNRAMLSLADRISTSSASDFNYSLSRLNLSLRNLALYIRISCSSFPSAQC